MESVPGDSGEERKWVHGYLFLGGHGRQIAEIFSVCRHVRSGIRIGSNFEGDAALYYFTVEKRTAHKSL